MVRGLLVISAMLAGGLVGLQVGPALWSVLEQVGLIATPICTDTVGITADAICSRPRSVVVVTLAVPVLCATAAGIVTWRILGRVDDAPTAHDSTA